MQDELRSLVLTSMRAYLKLLGKFSQVAWLARLLPLLARVLSLVFALEASRAWKL